MLLLTSLEFDPDLAKTQSIHKRFSDVLDEFKQPHPTMLVSHYEIIGKSLSKYFTQ